MVKVDFGHFWFSAKPKIIGFDDSITRVKSDWRRLKPAFFEIFGP